MNAIIITDYFQNSGMGNYIRSKQLYSYIKKKNFLKIDFHVLSKKRINKKRYNIIILDLPNYEYDICDIKKKFSKKLSRIMALDYTLKYKIDCNISVFKKNKFATKNYVGLKYSIIRDEFLNNRVKQNKDLLFISIGSSDIKNIKEKIKNIFLPYFKNIFMNDNIKKIKKNFKQKNYIKKMISCNMAVSNGGTTLLELLYLKKIVFVYPQNKLESNFSKYLKGKGYKILINNFKIDKKKIYNYKKKIQVDRQIDKFGLKRISKIIINYKNDLLK